MSASHSDRVSCVASSSSTVSMSTSSVGSVSKGDVFFGVPASLYPVTVLPPVSGGGDQQNCWRTCELDKSCEQQRGCDSYLQLRYPASTDASAATTCHGGLVFRSRPPSPTSSVYSSSSTSPVTGMSNFSSTSVISRVRSWPGGGRPWRLIAASKTLCAVSITMAFVLGILIGVLVPLYASKVLTPLDVVATEAPSAAIVISSLIADPADGKVSFVVSEPLYKSLSSDFNSISSSSDEKLPEWRRLVEGVYWTPEVEATLPRGFTDNDVAAWRSLTNHTPIVRMEEGCGRMQNRLVVFERGARSCARYRQNMDQIQGEIFSFYLSRILGFGNVPPASLDLVEATGPQWDRIRPELTLAQWMEQRPVVMTQWVDGLEPAHIPAPFRPSSRHLHPPDVNLQAQTLLGEEGQMDLKDLAQWSDLVVFDYLTANLDRVVNNLYNMQWNTGMMEAPAHNLARQVSTGLLVFLDNESGLLHGFRLLDKYEPYHRKLLDSLCVFRKTTVENLQKLGKEDDLSAVMGRVVAESHPEMADVFPALPEKYARILAERIQTVLKHVRRCERIYETS